MAKNRGGVHLLGQFFKRQGQTLQEMAWRYNNPRCALQETEQQLQLSGKVACGNEGAKIRRGAVKTGEISHNSVKPLPNRKAKSRNIFRFSLKSYVKSLSIPTNRHEYLSMPGRVNIRRSLKPAAKLRSIEREGVIYENDSRRCQDAIY